MTYEEIKDSIINGQKKQALNQIEEFTWYDFVSDLEVDYSITPIERLEWLCSLIRIKENK